jgi:16S rRNA (guanine527-N7)-methyltransferase
MKSLNVSRETISSFDTYFKEVEKWNQKMSLIQEKTQSEFYERHIIDSLQICQHLPDKNLSIADIGSGAGFPGMVLAMMEYKNVTLFESNSKKVVFLSEVARITNTKVSIVNERIEKTKNKYDVFVSRACCSLSILLRYMIDVSRETNPMGIFHKGQNFAAEEIAARENWLFDIEKHQSITSSDGVIVKITNVRERING